MNTTHLAPCACNGCQLTVLPPTICLSGNKVCIRIVHHDAAILDGELPIHLQPGSDVHRRYLQDLRWWPPHFCTPPTLDAGSSFIARCEFAAFCGPAYWHTRTNRLEKGNLFAVAPLNKPRALLPILIDSHWAAVEIVRLYEPTGRSLSGSLDFQMASFDEADCQIARHAHVPAGLC